MPAVLQLISFLADYRMAVGDAVRYPRIDVSGKDYVTVDARLPDAVAGALSGRYPVRVEPAGVYPNLFACPNIACHDPVSGTSTGAAFINSPVAAAMPEAASPAAA